MTAAVTAVLLLAWVGASASSDTGGQPHAANSQEAELREARETILLLRGRIAELTRQAERDRLDGCRGRLEDESDLDSAAGERPRWLSAGAPTPAAPPTPAPCLDDDAGMVAAAEQYGMGGFGIDGCSHSAVVSNGGTYSIIRDNCCVTCGGVQYPPAAPALPTEAPTPAAAPPTPAPCLDDDAGMVAAAEQYGMGGFGIDGCSHSAVVSNCGTYSIIRDNCCVTCGGVQYPPAAPAPPTEAPMPTAPGCVVASGLPIYSGSRRRHVVSLCPVGEFAICEGETSIEDDSFRDCQDITKVTIPDTVTSIGFGAFIRSTLQEVVWSRFLTYIGQHAFRETHLTRVDLPPALHEIDGYAFFETQLVQVAFPSSLARIGNLAFKETAITEVDLPESIEDVGSSAFIGCVDLAEVTIRSNFQHGNGLFSVCIGLIKATFASNATYVDDLGFSESSLREVVLDSVKRVGPGAFKECGSLQKVEMGNQVEIIDIGAFHKCEKLQSVVIPESVWRIDESAFDGCLSLERVTILGTVASAGRGIFQNTNLSQITFQPPASIVPNFYLGECCADARVELADSIVTIGDGALRNMSLREVSLPNSVTAIGPSAFQGCTELEEVHFPDGLAAIGASAFQGCTGLTRINLPDSVSTIGQSAFEGCTEVVEVATGSSIVEIGPGAFRDCSSLAEATLGERLSRIESGAFQNCVELRTLLTDGRGGVGGAPSARRLAARAGFGGELKKIGEAAFQNTALASLRIPSSVRVLERLAFSRIPQLASVEIEGSSDSFQEVGGYIFNESCGISNLSVNVSDDLEPKIAMPPCARITSVEVTSGFVSTKWLSSNCDHLANLQVHNDVVPAKAWQRCPSLKHVYFGSGVTQIWANAFRDCSALTAVQFASNSRLELIGDRAFWNCTELEDISIPCQATELGTAAFKDCSSLRHVGIHGHVKTLRDELFMGCTSLARVEIPDSLTSVSESAFSGCSSLDNVLLPSNVSFVADRSFKGCTSLQSVQLPADAIIGKDAFDFSSDMRISVAGAGQGFSPSWSTDEFAEDFGCRDTFIPRVATDARTLECQCPELWLYNHASKKCEECKRHLECTGGHSQCDADKGLTDTGVTVDEGYMTLPDDPFSVFSCVDQEQDPRCEGSRTVSSDEMCRYNADPAKPQCAVCREGFVKGADRKCISCDEETPVIPVLKAVLAFGLQFMLFAKVYYDSVMPTRPRHAIVDATIEFVQVVQAVLRMDVSFTAQFLAIKDMFDFFTLSALYDKFHFRSACFLGESYLLSITAQALTPLLLLVNLPILHLLCRARWKRRFGLTFDRVHNLIGEILSSLFLTLVSLSLSLFYTETMPNGKVMVKVFPELEYGSPAWQEALPINLVATAVYCIPVISIVVYAVWRAPRLAATSPGFLVRFEFCFDCVRPDRWWWIMFRLSLGLVLTSAQILLPDNVRSQIYLTLLGCFGFLVAEYSCWPNEFEDGNSASVSFKLAVIISLIVITSFPLGTAEFEESEKEVSETWSWIAILFITYACSNALARLARDVLKIFKPKGVEETEAQQTFWRFRDIAMCMLLLPEQELAKRVKNYTQYDNANLKTASNTIVNLIFDSQISDRWAQQRVMDCPRRVWEHHPQVAKLIESYGSGSVVKDVQERFALRGQIIKLATKLYDQGDEPRRSFSNQKIIQSLSRAAGIDSSVRLVSDLVRATTVTSLSPSASRLACTKETESFKDRLWRVMGMTAPSTMTKHDFVGLLLQLEADMTVAETDRLWAMLDIDESGEVPVPDITNLLSTLAPYKLVEELAKISPNQDGGSCPQRDCKADSLAVRVPIEETELSTQPPPSSARDDGAVGQELSRGSRSTDWASGVDSAARAGPAAQASLALQVQAHSMVDACSEEGPPGASVHGSVQEEVQAHSMVEAWSEEGPPGASVHAPVRVSL